ncbi:NAD(P)-dependent alcohol dehydrogenase [Sandaracinobacter sp.]|uniref:NAD(P)-dependent alcohol dehydrogenase n=1 Tax=Sandaracinobacter sp. TaxID=2487581 RepID=UPI0035AFC5F2
MRTQWKGTDVTEAVQAIAAVVHQPMGPFELRTIEVAAPGAGELRVAVKAVGICHTDLVFATGMASMTLPAVFGHEGAGIVEAVGPGVEGFSVGDKVLLTFDSCGHCRRCAEGHPAYCQDFPMRNYAPVRPDGTTALSLAGEPLGGQFFGQSSFASHAISRVGNTVKLPPDADLAMLAPLGCGVQTGAGAVLRSHGAGPEDVLVVIGGGAVGLSAVMGGKIAGCRTIILIEPRADRRALGLSLGAHHAIDPAAGDTAEAVRAISPLGADHVIDTSGHGGALQAGLQMLAPMGTLGLIGVPAQFDATLNLAIAQAITFGHRVMGIIEGDSVPADFLPQLVNWARSGALPVERMVTTYPFAEINRAIHEAHEGGTVKPVLLFD